MPCRDYYDNHPEAYFRDVSEPKLKKQIAFAESALCGALAALDRAGVDPLKVINFSEIGITPAELKKWWTEHQKLDEQHRLAELKAKALSKLTEEERKALGLS